MTWIDRLAPWWARRCAVRDLPGAASRMGLTFSEGEYKHEIGTLSGTLEGHEVLVRPDKPAIIVEHRHRIENVDLSTWSPPGLRRPEINFDSGNRAFDRAFKKRKLAPRWEKRLRRQPVFFERLVAFRRAWPQVSQIDVDTVRFSAWMKAHWVATCYVSVREVEGMVPEMIRILDDLEEALR